MSSSENGKQLQGRVALVTGSARGIGRSIAEDLAQWGAELIILDVNQEACDQTASEIAAKFGVKAVGVQCNVTVKQEVEALAEKIKTDFKTLHILVNNAGVTRDNLLVRMKEEEWDLVLDVNLKGPFLMTQALIRMLSKAQGGGSIVNISSVSGLLGQTGQTNYSSSKSGLIGLTKATAREYGAKNVRINAVCPGFIETEMTGKMPEKAVVALREMVPMKRAGQVRDISRVVRFLCSDEASYITGNIMRVDGGMAIGM